MKKRTLFLLLILGLMLQGCGLISSVRDLTDSATTLLDEISEVTRLVDAKVENGEISQEVADLIDERLANLASILETSIQNNGGFLFDQVNGTLDHAFGNIFLLLDQIKAGILDDSLPNLINQISSQLQLQINLVTSSIEDIITITFGNTMILVDKTTNSVVIIASIVFLAIGLIIFAILLFGKRSKLRGTKIVGVIIMAVYLGFFLTVILSSKLRGNIIAGFDYGKKVTTVEVQPKITGILPETFILGKNDRILIYGTHLNKLKNITVKLMQGNAAKITFPKNSVIVTTTNKIVLSNFNAPFKWITPKYQEFKTYMDVKNFSINTAQLTEISKTINKELFPGRITASNVGLHDAAIRMSMVPSITISDNQIRGIRKIENEKINRVINTVSLSKLGPAKASQFTSLIKDYFMHIFKLTPGDYGLTVFEEDNRVESPQFISIINPAPPPPKPDISPVGISWSGGLTPVAKQQTSLDIRLGFSHPEEISRPFELRITSSPATTPINVTVPMGAITAAYNNNLSTVTTRNFSISGSGVYNFKVTADNQNVISESNESNNELTVPLRVQRYIYDATVTFLTFKPKHNNEDGNDEYRIKITTSVTGYSDWKISYNKDGNPGAYSINKSKTFNNLTPGKIIMIATSGKEADSGFRDGDDGYGSGNYNKKLSENPTGGNDSKEYPFTIKAGKYYEIIGKIVINRRKVN